MSLYGPLLRITVPAGSFNLVPDATAGLIYSEQPHRWQLGPGADEAVFL